MLVLLDLKHPTESSRRVPIRRLHLDLVNTPLVNEPDENQEHEHPSFVQREVAGHTSIMLVSVTVRILPSRKRACADPNRCNDGFSENFGSFAPIL